MQVSLDEILVVHAYVRMYVRACVCVCVCVCVCARVLASAQLGLTRLLSA